PHKENTVQEIQCILWKFTYSSKEKGVAQGQKLTKQYMEQFMKWRRTDLQRAVRGVD
ncbi:hypothetical protein CCACVL1_19249, partial [Corchorus capsularis]